MPARVCEVVLKVPMLATPVETKLKPLTCAPTTGRSMPPARPLEDLAVAVDEEVVADVPPSAVVPVEPADGQHDRGRLAWPVAVEVVGVMDERVA